MALNSKKGLLTFSIDGENVHAPLDWQEISVLATFENDNVQANISTSEIEITLDAAEKVVEYVNSGTSGGVGIFEGLPCSLLAFNQNSEAMIFDGYIDLTEGYREELYNSRVFVTLKKKAGLNHFNDQLGANTYGYLESIGVFSDSDYLTTPYTVEKKDNALELVISAVTTFIMIKEAAESVRSATETVNDLATIIAGGGLTGALGAAVKAAGAAVIAVAYSAVLLSAVTQMAVNLFTALVPPVRKHKTIRVRALLEKVCNHLGYGFETDNTDIDREYFLPSNMNLDQFDKKGFINFPKGTRKGIPETGDPGYRCSEMFSILMEKFNSRFAIVDNIVHFRNVSSDYWIKRSTYRLPDVLERPKTYNTSDLYANRLISFATDQSDLWTIDNFKGTNYEVITTPINSRNADAVYIKGLDRISIPWALGSRKNELNGLEKALAELGGAVDTVTGISGGGTNFKAKIKNRVGILKVYTNNHAVPKLLVLDSKGKIPVNHRDLLSAKHVNTYQASKSFVADSYSAQKATFSGVRIPFGYEDFLATIDNSYCVDADGAESKIDKLEYNIYSDTAKADYRTAEVYTTNLQESFVEA